jgi:AcrR family transcriptional regulator
MAQYDSSDQKNVSVSDKRERILKAALHLFTTQGFHATPTSQISKEAQISTGTLFHYFPDKNTIIDELYLTIKKEMGDVVRGTDDASLPVKTLLERGFIRYIHWAIENPEKARFLMQFHHSPNISERVQSQAFDEFKWMHDIYTRAIGEGLLTDHPVHYHLVMTQQILNGIVELLSIKDDEIHTDEIISAGITKIWK